MPVVWLSVKQTGNPVPQVAVGQQLARVVDREQLLINDPTEIDVQARFKARAENYARQFGFGSYSIREVNVGQADAAFQQGMPRVRAMSASMATDEAVPVEAGKASVTVTVNGSVQMSPR